MPYTGDDYLKILDLTAEGQPQKYNDMLKDYHRLISERYPLTDYRKLSKKEAQARLAKIKAELIEALGILPHKDTTPPQMQSLGMLKRDDYTVEKVLFESMPGRPMTGLIYRGEALPKKKTPGILIVHGHGDQGKAQPVTQIRSIELARRGFIVLAVDTMGLGERKPLGHASFPIFATGVSLQALLVYENMRALDLLVSLPGVDGSKIGLTGSSGGGSQTTYLAALDERVTASVPTASACAYEDHSTHSSSYYCQCELVPHMVRFGDIGDWFALAAPRAVLVLMGTRDRTFPAKGARESYLRALDAFTALGVPENIEKFEAYTPHAYSRSVREAMYAFFEKRLMGKNEHALENSICTYEDPSGDEINVLKDGMAAGKKVFPATDLNTLAGRFGKQALEDRQHPANRLRGKAGLEKFSEEFYAARKELFGEPLGADVYPIVIKREQKTFGEYSVDCFLIETECGIIVPAFVASAPNTKKDAPIAFFLTEEGKNGVFFQRRAKDLFKAGFRVAGIDVRGTGETCYVYYSEEEYAVSNALVTGRALLDGRARDLALFADVLKSEGLAGKGIGIWIADAFSLYGALAAADSAVLKRAAVENGIVSLASEKGFCGRAFDYLFIPGILKALDIPQLLALVSPKPLLVVNPINAAGQPLSKNDATRSLAWSAEACAKGAFAVEAGLGDADARRKIVNFLKGGAAE